jgi:hypothetical protein
MVFNPSDPIIIIIIIIIIMASRIFCTQLSLNKSLFNNYESNYNLFLSISALALLPKLKRQTFVLCCTFLTITYSLNQQRADAVFPKA